MIEILVEAYRRSPAGLAAILNQMAELAEARADRHESFLTTEDTATCARIGDDLYKQIERQARQPVTLEGRLRDAIVSQAYRALMTAAVETHGERIQATAERTAREAVARGGDFASHLLYHVTRAA